MKKITAVILTLALAVSFTACSGGKEETTAPASTQQVSSSEKSVSSETKDAQNSKILIAYFSYGENAEFSDDVDASASASIQMLNGKVTGNTGLIADYIAKAAGGDLFSIITKEKYPSSYDETVDIGQAEKNNNVKPEIANHIDNLDDYDTIFIGFPNWWYGMPMVMYSFFDEYDFSGKTIIPFCTSGGSAFSDAISEMKSLEPNAEVMDDGLHIGASSASGAEKQVQEWVNRLNIK